MQSPQAGMFQVPQTSSMFGPPYGGQQGYGAAPFGEEAYNRKVPAQITNARYSIAYLATVAQLCIYSAPVIMGLQLGTDPDSVYWVGRAGVYCVFVPISIMVLHIIHLIMLRMGRPAKGIFLFMAVIPGAVIAYVGSRYAGSGGMLYGVLISEDCSKGRGHHDDTYQAEKHHLQEVYDTARDILTTCRDLEKLIVKEEYDLPQSNTITSEPTLLNCQSWALHGQMHDKVTGWTAWSEKAVTLSEKYKKEFNYLASVEANNLCGGFCEPGPMLWIDYDIAGSRATERHAACAPLIGSKFNTIIREGKLCFWIGILSMFLLLLAFQLLKPLLEYLGYRATP